MKKYLVTIKFRYVDAPDKYGLTCKEKVLTIGVYDELEDAIKNGNEALEVLESRHKLNVYADGSTAPRCRFSKNGGPFGSPNTLITQTGYLRTPYEFYARIETLVYGSVNDTIDSAVESIARYRAHKELTED